MKKNVVSNNVIRRLPRYLRKLDELIGKDIQRTSSAEFGEMLGLTSSQIRQDLSAFGEFGQQGYGYNPQSLRDQLAAILGMDRDYKVILLGVGNIGRALIDKFSFNDWGFDLVAAFDVEESLIGTEQNGVPILDSKALPQYLAEHPVDAAVLCVPRDRAVPAAEQLIRHGVDAIWNFTNMEIVEPYSPVIVENVHFSDSLLALSYYLTARRAEKPTEDQTAKVP